MASRAGAKVAEIDMPPLEAFQAFNPNAMIQPVEAMVWHRDLIGRRGTDYDPNVKARIEAGDLRHTDMPSMHVGVIPKPTIRRVS
jgi:hypothetical protein